MFHLYPSNSHLIPDKADRDLEYGKQNPRTERRGRRDAVGRAGSEQHLSRAFGLGLVGRGQGERLQKGIRCCEPTAADMVMQALSDRRSQGEDHPSTNSFPALCSLFPYF